MLIQALKTRVGDAACKDLYGAKHMECDWKPDQDALLKVVSDGYSSSSEECLWKELNQNDKSTWNFHECSSYRR